MDGRAEERSEQNGGVMTLILPLCGRNNFCSNRFIGLPVLGVFYHDQDDEDDDEDGDDDFSWNDRRLSSSFPRV